MTVRVYRSTDAGAPVLNGQVGSLISVLDWCLVAGAPTPAGWTKEYSGTTKAAYKQGAGSNGFYLRVEDPAPTSGTNYARLVGYETMSDVDTGTNAFPHFLMLQNGGYYFKSNDLTATSRPWVMVATEKIFYMWSAQNLTVGTYNAWLTAFGDFESHVANDQSNTILMCGHGTGLTTSASGTLVQSPTSAIANYVAKSPYNLGGGIDAAKMSVTAITSGYVGQGRLPYPEPNTGGLVLFPIYVTHGNPLNLVRGKLPGLWAMGHSLYNVNVTGDTFSGAVGTALEGKTFEMFRGYSGGTPCMFVLETSDTW